MQEAMVIPPVVLRIIRTLNQNHFEAYVVGGCVRDSILGRKPQDWDITTNATPEEIKACFQYTIDTGIKHGTVTVRMDHVCLEVTTFRLEKEYRDHRRPDEVQFTPSLAADLGRRDFTMNAIAYHPDIGFADPYGGTEDIGRKQIRAVGAASKRFGEDALRMLRAIRFAAQLDFEIEDSTLSAIREQHALISFVSWERIRDELTKLLLSEQPLKFNLLRETGLLAMILPELEACYRTVQHNPYHIYDVGAHSIHGVDHVEADRILRWTMLLHDLGKPPSKTTDQAGIDHFYGHPVHSVELARVVLERLKFDHKTRAAILKLIQYHDLDFQADDRGVRRAVAKVGDDIFEKLLQVKEADCRSQNPVYLNERLAKLAEIHRIYQDIRRNKQCLHLKDLAVNGSDLLDIGMKPGREIGGLLAKLLDRVIAEPELNTREQLLDIVKRLREG